jgi:hypothetical protein
VSAAAFLAVARQVSYRSKQKRHLFGSLMATNSHKIYIENHPNKQTSAKRHFKNNLREKE